MSSRQSTTSFADVLKHRSKLVFGVFLGVLAVCGVVSYLMLQYSASAVLALNPHATPVSNGQQPSVVQTAWSALSDQEIQSLIGQFHVDSGSTRLLAQGSIFTYVRSRISIGEVGSSADGPPQVEVSYRGPDRSNVVDFTNALAQSLTEVTATKVPGATTSDISQELAKSRQTLQQLSVAQDVTGLQAQVQQHLKIDAELRAKEQEIEVALSSLDEERHREELAFAKAHAQPPPPPPPNPERVALQHQLRDAQEQLNQLRQRYTEEYPDVVEARNAVAGIEAKLSRIPPDKLPPQRPKVTVAPVDEGRFASQRAELEDSQADLQDKIQQNQQAAEAIRQRIAAAKGFASDYALEQAHYNALLKAQQAGPVSRTGSASGAPPLFLIVASATSADPRGLAVQPEFWALCACAALLLAFFAAYIAEQYDPTIEKGSASSQGYPSREHP